VKPDSSDPSRLRQMALSRWDTEGGAGPCGPQESQAQADVAHVEGRRIAIHRKGSQPTMAHEFNVGDHVTWNSEAGHVSGRIIKVHTKNVAYKGYTHHASEADPQYEIQSDKSDHIAMHKGSALHKKSG